MFVVIEGVDGCGKATQTKLLKENFTKQGKKVDTISFPSYGQPSGYFVEQFLNQKYGPLDELDPQLASMFYIIDRFDQKKRLTDLLDGNDIVVSDRYCVSNFIHRGTKFLEKNQQEEMEKFFTRLFEWEFVKAGLPQPDMIFFLRLSMPTIEKLLEKKRLEDRGYVQGGGLDHAEQDREHQRMALQIGEQVLPEYFSNYQIIDCEDTAGNIMTVEEINQKLMEKIGEL